MTEVSGLITVESIQIGARSTVTSTRGDPLETGIRKQPVDHAQIETLGLVGDVIVDTEIHGGVDQAVYIYARDDYHSFSDLLGRKLPAGLFGENLTLTSVGNGPARIGDRLLIGDVELEIAGPRIPCMTFAARLERPDWVRTFRQRGRPGYYCRVIAEGEIRIGQTVTRTAASAEHPTVADVFALFYDPASPPAQLQRCLDSPLTGALVDRFTQRLQRKST